MTGSLFRYAGRFQWWSYDVSHGQLLLRSTKSAVQATQVDVLFKDVVFVKMATSIESIEVLEAREELPNGVELRAGRKCFLVRGKEESGFVVAGSVFHISGYGDHGDPSPLIPKFPPD